MSSNLSRRGLFSLLGRPLRSVVDTSKAVTGGVVDKKTTSPAPGAEAPAKVAIIQGRFCLAYTSFCTVCSERCPVPGAMKVERGIPMVVADVCTGCGICADLCESGAVTLTAWAVPHREQVRLHEARCPKCGTVHHSPRLRDDGLCEVCARSRRAPWLFVVEPGDQSASPA